MFKHLREVKQGYFEHFINAMSYCLISLTASFYFLVHAIWPDIFEFNGSRQIRYLNDALNMRHNMDI
jgi:hypothetical protein